MICCPGCGKEMDLEDLWREYYDAIDFRCVCCHKEWTFEKVKPNEDNE